MNSIRAHTITFTNLKRETSFRIPSAFRWYLWNSLSIFQHLTGFGIHPGLVNSSEETWDEFSYPIKVNGEHLKVQACLSTEKART